MCRHAAMGIFNFEAGLRDKKAYKNLGSNLERIKKSLKKA
jgi:hypothetical protein